MSKYLDKATIQRALLQLKGTSGPFFRIWLTMKHMGLSPNKGISVTTGNSADSLKRLFGCGDPDGRFFTPTVSTPSDRFMKSDAYRSIIQTNIKQWMDGSGTTSPTGFLNISPGENDGASKPIVITTKRTYPAGLGYGKNGFAHSEGKRVVVPKIAFAVWYGRQTPIPTSEQPTEFLLNIMKKELNLSLPEEMAVFQDKELEISTSNSPVSDSELYELCVGVDERGYVSVEYAEPEEEYLRKIHSMQTIDERPSWLKRSPDQTLEALLGGGVKSILLYGPPRTGKTRYIDKVFDRTDPNRVTVQIHDGWGYENLIQGLASDGEGGFSWKSGCIVQAIRDGKKYIVLEEINRTSISQALGEVFSLIEDAYRGESNAMLLRDGSKFFIPEDVVFFMTMNTIDKSTEDVDDALIGRLHCVEFPTRVEDLAEILSENHVSDDVSGKLRELFTSIQEFYPLGHGYFAQFGPDTDPIMFYMTKIRPVIMNHLRYRDPKALDTIDSLVDDFFGS